MTRLESGRDGRTPEGGDALDAGADAEDFLHPPVEAVRVAHELLKALAPIQHAPRKAPGQPSALRRARDERRGAHVGDLGDEAVLLALEVAPAVKGVGAAAGRGVGVGRRRDDEGGEGRAAVHGWAGGGLKEGGSGGADRCCCRRCCWWPGQPGLVSVTVVLARGDESRRLVPDPHTLRPSTPSSPRHGTSESSPYSVRIGADTSPLRSPFGPASLLVRACCLRTLARAASPRRQELDLAADPLPLLDDGRPAASSRP